MILYSSSSKETRKLASNLAAKMNGGPTSLKLRRARIIALEGELGAGKTTFAQAFVKALGVRAKVKSPTFNIIKKYKVPKKDISVYHIDCYRLKDHNEAVPLGVKEIFKEKGSIILVEWPERIKKILPKDIVIVHIDHINRNKRKIQITKSK